MRITSAAGASMAIALVACTATSTTMETEACAGKCDDPLTLACPDGIALPPVVVTGYVVHDPIAPQLARAWVIGRLDERAPSLFDYTALGSYTSATGLSVRGWAFDAAAGEAFKFAAHSGTFPAGDSYYLRVYGPVDDCAAPVANPYVSNSLESARPEHRTGTWTAPTTGRYIVAPWYSVQRDNGGVVDVQIEPNTYHSRAELTFQRLLSDSTPASHALVRERTWPLYKAVAAQLENLDGERAVVVAGQTRYADSSGDVVVIAHADDLDHPVTTQACGVPNPGPNAEKFTDGDLLAIADFNHDGRDDVLFGASLLLARAGGGWTCEPSALMSGWPNAQTIPRQPHLGAADLDGDGVLDIITYSVEPSSTIRETSLVVRPLYRRGPGYTVGASRTATVPISAFHQRLGFRDIDGDGRAEILFAVRGITPTSDVHVQKGFAFMLPAPLAADALGYQGDAEKTPLLPASVNASGMFNELGYRGPRFADLDGDGLEDVVNATRVDWSRLSVNYWYGTAPGEYRELPWTVVSNDEGYDDPFVAVEDLDGDGCLDVVEAGKNVAFLRGLRCRD